jgi:hypothetical protein
MHLTRFLAFASVMVALAAPSVTADTIALTSFTGGLNATSGSDQIYGWEFTLSSSVNVTALGVYDINGASGLSISHAVGIWDATSQDLLTSATVPAGTAGTLVDNFMYVSLASPYTLAAGEYVIGMTMPQGNADQQYIEVSSETTSSPVTYVNSAFGTTSGSTLAFPSSIGAFAPGMFGPNFQFGSAAIPEPSTLVLGIMPVAVGLGAFLRRRRSTN